ncbi:zinc-finger protein, partial [Coemansia linderi]
MSGKRWSPAAEGCGDARLAPLHKHAQQGLDPRECESGECARPLTLPSLSALGIADTARSASATLAHKQTSARSVGSVSPGAGAGAMGSGSSDETGQRCLWSTCTQMFQSLDELVRHLYKLHVSSNVSELQGLMCRWASCSARKPDTEELLDHVCRDHLEATVHRCGWTACGRDYGTIDALTEHLAAGHVGGGRSSYACEWEGCERGGRPFAQRQRALRHIQTHTGAKPFACDVCGKRFSEAHIMQQHLRVHTGEKPFKCSQDGCGK